jgi:hypothetical protein
MIMVDERKVARKICLRLWFCIRSRCFMVVLGMMVMANPYSICGRRKSGRERELIKGSLLPLFSLTGCNFKSRKN